MYLHGIKNYGKIQRNDFYPAEFLIRLLKRTSTIILAAGCLAILGAGITYLLTQWPQYNSFFNSLPIQGNISRLKSFILSFGLWAPLISAAFMVAQSVILFLPAFPLFVVNALAFGLFWGTLLSWSGAVLGSVACFTIGKLLGRPYVQRLVNQVHLEAADRTLKRYEKYVILLFGFIPIISFDVISYAAGLTALSYKEFILLVCIAQIPSALFYSLLLSKIDQGTLNIYWVVAAIIFFFLGLVGLLIRIFVSYRREKKKPPAIS